MKKKKVLVTVTNYSKYCGEGKKILEDGGCEMIENRKGRPLSADELKTIIGEVDGVVAGVDTWNDEIFSHASNLKTIARFGVGVDNIDLQEAKRHRIVVCNSPGINSSAVAEQTIALMLSLVRAVPRLNGSIRKGEWQRPMFHEMRSRTVGLLGFGAIAKNVAVRLRGFSPRMIAYDKYPDVEKAKSLEVEMVSLEQIFELSDIISIHLPATEETHHLICRENIEKMKDGVLIVNTARGNIVNENGLAEALQNGKVGGMGTDVFETEPVDLKSQLFRFDNYIATPHVSAETFENCEETSIVTARAILDVFTGKEPENRLV